jgi:hypothetical protein
MIGALTAGASTRQCYLWRFKASSARAWLPSPPARTPSQPPPNPGLRASAPCCVVLSGLGLLVGRCLQFRPFGRNAHGVGESGQPYEQGGGISTKPGAPSSLEGPLRDLTNWARQANMLREQRNASAAEGWHPPTPQRWVPKQVNGPAAGKQAARGPASQRSSACAGGGCRARAWGRLQCLSGTQWSKAARGPAPQRSSACAGGGCRGTAVGLQC